MEELLLETENKVKEIVIEVLYLEITPDELSADQPFFGIGETPGLIDDSLAILEIASKISDEFGILPGDIEHSSFQNVGTLSKFIHFKLSQAA